MKNLSALLLSIALPMTVAAAPTVVTCESHDNKMNECEMDTSGVVVVERQLSHTRCVQDQNWGLNRHSVWVKDGCRAVFALQGANQDRYEAPASSDDDSGYQSSGHAPSAAVRACNEFADQGYDGTIVSQNPMKPGWWEIVLRYEEYRYVCNVSSNGKVDSFDKLD
jgi:hypothetical protein